MQLSCVGALQRSVEPPWGGARPAIPSNMLLPAQPPPAHHQGRAGARLKCNHNKQTQIKASWCPIKSESALMVPPRMVATIQEKEPCPHYSKTGLVTLTSRFLSHWVGSGPPCPVESHLLEPGPSLAVPVLRHCLRVLAPGLNDLPNPKHGSGP